MRFLLVIVLALSSVAFGSGPQDEGQGAESPKLQLEQPGIPHLDIAKNCRTMIQKDNSVLTTCECEACAQPDAHDGMDAVPWNCMPREGGLYCSYEIDTQTSGEKKHSRI